VRPPTFFPSKKNKNVGVPRILYIAATSPPNPTPISTFTNATLLPACSSANRSKAGSTILHGAHVSLVKKAVTQRRDARIELNEEGLVESWIGEVSVDV